MMSHHAARRVILTLLPACLLLPAGWASAAPGQVLPAESTRAAPTAPAAAPAAASGKDFPFEDQKGKARTLQEFRGRVVLLEFWAPWCVPCRKGFPWLEDLQQRQGAAGLQVIAVTMETDDASVSSFLSDHPVTFVVGRDRTGRSAELYEVAAMPTTIVLDREGREIARFEGGGESLHAALEKAVAGALAGGGPEVVSVRKRAGARGHLRPWERGYLADPIMNLDGDRLTRAMREHVHASKEAAAGDGGVAGGGCGCN
jgi:thiol-disulfide isomerase/thioredoxin